MNIKQLKLNFKLEGKFKPRNYVFLIPGAKKKSPRVRKRRDRIYCYLPEVHTEKCFRNALERGFEISGAKGYEKIAIRVEEFILPSFALRDIAKILAEEILKISYPASRIESVVFLFREGTNLKEFYETFDSHRGYILRKISRIPIPTVDAIIPLSGRKILLIRRKNPPFGWALPGGFLEYNESLEECVKREVEEETGLKVKSLRQFHTYSQPGRDPRFHTVSTVFVVTTGGVPRAGSDAKEFGIFKINSLPPRKEFAFDHWQIIQDWIKSIDNK